MHTQLTHLHPFREMETFFDHYVRAMNRTFLQHEQRVATAAIAEWAPTVDVSETDAEYGVRAELPGVEKEDVNVSVENAVLTIQGEKKVEVTEGHGEKKHCVECAYGSFLRTFVLPSNADADSIDASFKQGVLKLSISKSAESKAKTVDIKAD